MLNTAIAEDKPAALYKKQIEILERKIRMLEKENYIIKAKYNSLLEQTHGQKVIDKHMIMKPFENTIDYYKTNETIERSDGVDIHKNQNNPISQLYENIKPHYQPNNSRLLKNRENTRSSAN